MDGRKKIGMLTFHQCHNYGAMLSAYALQQKVISMGYLAEYIDIENENMLEYGKKAGHQLYRREGREADKYKEKYQKALKKRWEYFERFKSDYLQCSEIVESEEQTKRLLCGYNMLLIGGDQLWNEELMVSTEIFVLPFDTKQRKVSYGTSMGAVKNMSLRRRMYLNKFDAIGVRETYAAEFVAKYSGISATITVDPVFLLKKQKWEQFSKLPEESNYIFAYLFNKKNEDFLSEIQQLNEISDRYQKKVILCASDMIEAADQLDVRIAVSPREWLGYILKAEFVITNSFHGVAFSLIFEKNFICLDRDCRVKELLVSYGLVDKIPENINMYEYVKSRKIDYCYLKQQFQEKIEQSYQFLENSLMLC